MPVLMKIRYEIPMMVLSLDRKCSQNCKGTLENIHSHFKKNYIAKNEKNKLILIENKSKTIFFKIPANE